LRQHRPIRSRAASGDGNAVQQVDHRLLVFRIVLALVTVVLGVPPDALSDITASVQVTSDGYRFG
jgi:hypothetical protein